MDYLLNLQFEWDSAKSIARYQERGFDFAYVVAAFGDPARRVRLDDRYDYGEERYQLIGEIEGRLFVVIYTLRNTAIRIISARKANAREARQYERRSQEDQNARH